MPIIDRPDHNRRRQVPAAIKLMLLVMVILGFYFRSCWYEKRESYYEFTSIELTGQTLSSVDVVFEVINSTALQREEPILIRLFTDRGEEIASRITSVEIVPRSRRRYRKMVEGWSRPLYEGEQLSHATVELFKPQIF